MVSFGLIGTGFGTMVSPKHAFWFGLCGMLAGYWMEVEDIDIK